MTQVDTQYVGTDDSMDTVDDQDLYGMLAQYETVDEVKAAAVAMKQAGYRYFEVYSPFPVHGIDAALDIHPTILPWLVLGGGLVGGGGGLGLMIYTMAFDYPYLISGKPFNSLPAWIPVTFECTILLAALTAVFGMLLMNRLPLLSHPLFRSERFRRATDDRFFVAVLTRDAKFDRQQTAAFLREQGATAVELLEA